MSVHYTDEIDRIMQEENVSRVKAAKIAFARKLQSCSVEISSSKNFAATSPFVAAQNQDRNVRSTIIGWETRKSPTKPPVGEKSVDRTFNLESSSSEVGSLVADRRENFSKRQTVPVWNKPATRQSQRLDPAADDNSRISTDSNKDEIDGNSNMPNKISGTENERESVNIEQVEVQQQIEENNGKQRNEDADTDTTMISVNDTDINQSEMTFNDDAIPTLAPSLNHNDVDSNNGAPDEKPLDAVVAETNVKMRIKELMTRNSVLTTTTIKKPSGKKLTRYERAVVLQNATFMIEDVNAICKACNMMVTDADNPIAQFTCSCQLHVDCMRDGLRQNMEHLHAVRGVEGPALNGTPDAPPGLLKPTTIDANEIDDGGESEIHLPCPGCHENKIGISEVNLFALCCTAYTSRIQIEVKRCVNQTCSAVHYAPVGQTNVDNRSSLAICGDCKTKSCLNCNSIWATNHTCHVEHVVGPAVEVSTPYDTILPDGRDSRVTEDGDAVCVPILCAPCAVDHSAELQVELPTCEDRLQSEGIPPNQKATVNALQTQLHNIKELEIVYTNEISAPTAGTNVNQVESSADNSARKRICVASKYGHICKVCYCEVDAPSDDTELAVELYCGCSIHYECLIGYLQSCLGNKEQFVKNSFGVYCPFRDALDETSCSAIFDMTAAHELHLFSLKHFNQTDDNVAWMKQHVRKFEKFALQGEDYVPCPKCDTVHFRLDDMKNVVKYAFCRHCSFKFCCRCCDAWNSLSGKRHDCIATEKQEAEDDREIALTELFIRATTKACPNKACNARITHYHGHGCHHVQGCPMCKTHFCYLCFSTGEDNLKERGAKNKCKCSGNSWSTFCNPGNLKDFLTSTPYPHDSRCLCCICPDCRQGNRCENCNGGCVVCMGLIEPGPSVITMMEKGVTIESLFTPTSDSGSNQIASAFDQRLLQEIQQDRDVNISTLRAITRVVERARTVDPPPPTVNAVRDSPSPPIVSTTINDGVSTTQDGELQRVNDSLENETIKATCCCACCDYCCCGKCANCCNKCANCCVIQ